MTEQMEKIGRTRDEMAMRLAQDIPDGSYVNLGIGIPELVAKFVPEGREFIYHTENGLLGMGPTPEEGEEAFPSLPLDFLPPFFPFFFPPFLPFLLAESLRPRTASTGSGGVARGTASSGSTSSSRLYLIDRTASAEPTPRRLRRLVRARAAG